MVTVVEHIHIYEDKILQIDQISALNSPLGLLWF